MNIASPAIEAEWASILRDYGLDHEQDAREVASAVATSPKLLFGASPRTQEEIENILETAEELFDRIVIPHVDDEVESEVRRKLLDIFEDALRERIEPIERKKQNSDIEARYRREWPDLFGPTNRAEKPETVPDSSLLMNDSWPSLENLATDGVGTPLKGSKLPEWANPERREENYHHALRRLFESSEWDIRGFGPEGDIGGRFVDIVLDVPSVDGIIEIEREFIGIEVKSEPDAFETSTDNLEQLQQQARMGTLDRLYVCTPDSDQETRLDIDPKGTTLTNLLNMAQTSMAFRGLTGTIRQRDGTEIPKVAYYKRLLSQDTSKLVEELERRGDFGQVKQNLEKIERAALSDDVEGRSNEWVNPVLQKIGIIRFDTDTGEIRVTHGAERLERTRTPSCVRPSEGQESDVVHAIWKHFINQPETEVCVEVELPSLRDIREEDRAFGTSNPFFKDYFGRNVRRSAPRIDLVVAGDELRGIEVKGNDPNWDNLIHDQLPTYTAATELDAVDVAVFATEVETALEYIEEEYPEVGLLSVSNPRGRPVIERIR